MTNAELAARFHEMAALLELKGLAGFKLRAYQRAAQSIEEHPEPLSEVHRRGGLETVRGIGESFARKIEEILQTGTCRLLEELRAELPPAILQLMRVPGVGPKSAAMIWRELGVSDLDGLEDAAGDGRLAALRGWGSKRAAAVLAGIEGVRRWGGRTPIATALPLAQGLLSVLRGHVGVVAAAYAGSLRRGLETVGDLDLLVSTLRPREVLDAFAAGPFVSEVLALGDTKASVRVRDGFQVDVRAVAPEQYAAALLYFTGSKEHNVRLRELAKSRGLRLNEYGLTCLPGAEDPPGLEAPPLAARSEAELYAALGLEYIPPELREDTGEIEAAAGSRLPELVDPADIRGDLHTHTDWSDGRDPAAVLAGAAAARGLEYLAITDHSRSLAFARGLTSERLASQAEDIDALNRGGGRCRILRGCEVEVLAGGELDLPDEVLRRLDWVVAAVHTPSRRDGPDLTARLVGAARHPLVDVIAHPTGRIIGARQPYELDSEALIAAAAETGTALELNASPHRLDVPPPMARRAVGAGVKIAISTDAHDHRNLGDMEMGVWSARRGWVRREDVLNALSLEQLLEWRRRRLARSR
ncbi:MAG: DNA polymerase/3'-5' exonuclease PolX [Bacillota bacterium]|nr:DNA polymerase/3'-5' exonuclease PolX [Bacillota bacterium]